MQNKNTARKIASQFTERAEHVEAFALLHEFLLRNMGLFGWRGRRTPDLETSDGIAALAKKFFRYRNRALQPSVPSTVPDTMVNEILMKYYGYPSENLDHIVKTHRYAMVAENLVGEFLEAYLDSVLSKHGWIWCCGAVVKHTDFIKKENDDFRMLQVKNRDNSENSSSKAIRNNTGIEHWFRTFSRTGATNWNSFPDEDLRKELSEDGFIEFVRNYKEASSGSLLD